MTVKHKSLTVIKASAGSGKTFQLAYEYIKLLLGEKDKETREYHLVKVAPDNMGRREEYHQHILAVTFTNKATEEMKLRIVKELLLITRGEGGYINNLVKDLNTTEVKLIEAAKIILADLLFNYHEFNVSTIDSFFQTVLRTFAFELELDYEYEVEIEDDYPIKMGVNKFLIDIGGGYMNNTLVHQWVMDFMSNKLEEGKPWNLFTGDELAGYAKTLTTELYQKHKDEIMAYLSDIGDPNPRVKQFRDFLGAQYAKQKKVQEGYAEEFNAILAKTGIGEAGYELSSRSGLADLKKLVEGTDCVKGILDKVESWDRASQKKWCTAKDWKSKADKGAFDDQLEEMKNLAKKAYHTYKSKERYADLSNNLFRFGLLGMIARKMEDFLQENNTVLLSDTNKLLTDVLKEGLVLFVYERMGVEIKHYLIDEFQDTSVMQYNNMKPLLENSVANGDDNLIIGDEKQCIYRFRNSSPELFQSQIEVDFGDSVYVDRDKVTNWRSKPNVVRFNNTLFSLVVDKLKATDTYSNLVQTVKKGEFASKGYVRINLWPEVGAPEDFGIALSEAEIAKLSADADNGGKTEKMKFNDAVVMQMPHYIADLIWSRGFEQKDIAVLVNRNSEGSAIISSIMAYNETLDDDSKKINVITNDSMLVNSSPAVRLVVSNLRYFDSVSITKNEHDSLQKVQDREAKVWRVLRDYEKLESREKPKTGEACGELLKKVIVEDKGNELKYNGNAEDSLFSKEYLAARAELIEQVSDGYNVLMIAENIIRKMVPEDDRKNENAYLMAFMDCMYEFTTRYPASVHEFLKYWDNRKDKLSVSLPSGNNAVRVLTIHKSKGLEFPCCIVPFARWDMVKMNESLWVDREALAGVDGFSDVDSDIIPPFVSMKTSLIADTPNLEGVYMAERKLSAIDNLNKTYVAFTRAVDELHIFAPQSTKEKDFEKDSVELNDLLCTALPQLDDAYASAKNEAYDHYGSEVAVPVVKRAGDSPTIVIYEVGEAEPVVKPKNDNGDKKNKEKPLFNLKDANGMSHILDEVGKDVPVFYSCANTLDVCAPEQYTALQDKGIRLHRLFEKIKYAWMKDKVLEVSRKRGLIRDFYDDAKKIVDRAFATPEAKAWFDDRNKVMTERTIVVQDPKKGKVRKRIDRLVERPDGTVVLIDYKFGNDHGNEDKYRRQVLGYISNLADSGLVVDEGYVWYPIDNVIIRVK